MKHAGAVLDVLWAVIAERNAIEGETHPVPGLIWHHLDPEALSRRLLQLPQANRRLAP
jgi:hypothetical protein